MKYPVKITVTFDKVEQKLKIRDCRIIDACQRLLQQGAGKDFGGFQSVCLGQTMYFSVERGKFIQILHTGHSHWVTIITDNTVDPCSCVCLQ